MRILVDTNVLVSAALFPKSVSAQAFMKAAAPPNKVVVCDYSLDEMRRVFNRKFPHRLHELESFISSIATSAEWLATSVQNGFVKGETAIRDINDRPIFRAAVGANVNAILTGDKDFLESGLTYPRMLTPSDFLQLQ